MSFNTPLIIVPNMSLDEIELEIDQLFLRKETTQAWLNNQLSTSDFLDLLDEQGFNVEDLINVWDAGIKLI